MLAVLIISCSDMNAFDGITLLPFMIDLHCFFFRFALLLPFIILDFLLCFLFWVKTLFSFNFIFIVAFVYVKGQLWFLSRHCFKMFARGKNAAVLPLFKIIRTYHTSTAKIDPTFIDLNQTSLQHGKVAGFCLPDITRPLSTSCGWTGLRRYSKYLQQNSNTKEHITIINYRSNRDHMSLFD